MTVGVERVCAGMACLTSDPLSLFLQIVLLAKVERENLVFKMPRKKGVTVAGWLRNYVTPGDVTCVLNQLSADSCPDIIPYATIVEIFGVKVSRF